MKALFILIACSAMYILVLAGCSTTNVVDYCTMKTVDQRGRERCHAWQFAPTPIQAQKWDRRYGLQK